VWAPGSWAAQAGAIEGDVSGTQKKLHQHEGWCNIETLILGTLYSTWNTSALSRINKLVTAGLYLAITQWFPQE